MLYHSMYYNGLHYKMSVLYILFAKIYSHLSLFGVNIYKYKVYVSK